MSYLVLADVIAFMHLLFVLFVVFGALLVLRWPWMLWIHGPALLWGLFVEFAGAICPLTPLESRLRLLGGEAGYSEDFLSHWLLSVLYPESLSRGLQSALGASLLLLNIGLYLWIWRRRLGRC
jgi:Protein of Unknown function (DUF2784)